MDLLLYLQQDMFSQPSEAVASRVHNNGIRIPFCSRVALLPIQICMVSAKLDRSGCDRIGDNLFTIGCNRLSCKLLGSNISVRKMIEYSSGMYMNGSRNPLHIDLQLGAQQSID